MDLVGPWKLGKDRALNQPATLFLIASRTVLLPNSLGPLGDKEQTGGINADDPTGVDDGDGWMEDDVLDDYEHGVEESLDLERDPSPEALALRQKRGEEAWLGEAAGLQEPVPTHDLIFCEPITSNNSLEVLRAIQRVCVRA